ncbi:MAG TPA: hypothetical protein VHS96_11805 [Bacteroidia bacterium]|nr:hypothetical protein [Bacteroidia bacterium]
MSILTYWNPEMEDTAIIAKTRLLNSARQYLYFREYHYIQRPQRFYTYEFGLYFKGKDGYTRNYADTTFTTW